MLDRIGLPRPRISSQLYMAAVLTLLVVCGIAAVVSKFASDTVTAAARLRDQGLAPAMSLSRAEVLLAENRRLAAAAAAADREAAEQAARTFRENGRQLGELFEQLGYSSGHPVARRLAVAEAQGTAVFDLDAGTARERAIAAERYAASSEDLRRRLGAEREQRMHAAGAGLDSLAERSRLLTTWVMTTAAIAALLIGPLGLFMLRKVLTRMETVGSALGRLARNDTSVDIPDLEKPDEIGEFARSVAVFKAKSIELLQKKAELERVNLQLDAAINNMPVGLSMFDAQDRLLVCNARYAEMYRLPGELTVPGTGDGAHTDHRARQGARHHQIPPPDARRAEEAPSAVPMMIELDDQRVIAVSRQPLKGGGWVALHEDVTERHRHEQEIIRLSRHDPLTNLANRVLFKEQLHQALQRLARGQGFAVLCLDLDRFKAVNDTMGHPIGDALLRQVSERLLSCVRQGDLVARLGGDEFAIIQASVRDPSQTESLANRIVETVSNPYLIEGHRIDISTSIGMTLAPRDGSDADALMKNADLALYRTKSAGRRGYSFYKPEMNDALEDRRSLEGELRAALESDSLDILYEPVVALDTGRIAGFEALPRWTHREWGPMSGDPLMVLAEEIGLAAEIGEWTLRRACSEAAQWSVPVRVGVNIVPLQFRRNLIDLVLQALAESRLPSHRLEIEIAEGVLLQESQNALAMLHQLRQLGVRIVMDDFGTGYGSLSYLRSFPFDKIKIDRALIADVARTDESAALVEAVISLGRRLGMSAVAEGIESEAQLDRMRALGCSEVQGFYFGSGTPASEIELVLAGTLGPARSAA